MLKVTLKLLNGSKFDQRVICSIYRFHLDYGYFRDLQSVDTFGPFKNCLYIKIKPDQNNLEFFKF